MTKFDEVATGNDKLLIFVDAEFLATLTDIKVRNIGNVRFGSNTEVVLHAPLGRQSIVVPAHGVNNVPPHHATVPCNYVLMGVREYVPGM